MANQPDRSSAQRGPDPVVNADAGTGTTAPEQGAQSANVVGRPTVEQPRTAFHEPAETKGDERKPFNETEALEKGGSFDAVAPPGDTPSP